MFHLQRTRRNFIRFETCTQRANPREKLVCCWSPSHKEFRNSSKLSKIPAECFLIPSSLLKDTRVYRVFLLSSCWVCCCCCCCFYFLLGVSLLRKDFNHSPAGLHCLLLQCGAMAQAMFLFCSVLYLSGVNEFGTGVLFTFPLFSALTSNSWSNLFIPPPRIQVYLYVSCLLLPQWPPL